MSAPCLLSAVIFLAFGCLALAALLIVHGISHLRQVDPHPRVRTATRRVWTLLGATLLLLLFPAQSVTAEHGIAPWFVCGIAFWGACEAPRPQGETGFPEPVTDQAEYPALEDLHMWGTPLVGPSGAVSYQLPPRPVLDLFAQPSDETARAYLQWMSDKAERREAAFAAIRRIAPELGYTLGKDGLASTLAPLGSDDTDMSSVLAFTGLASHTDPLATRSPSAATDGASGARAVPDATQASIGTQTRIFYFFSPQCPSCAQQTPLLNALARGRNDIVGIAMDTTEQELIAYVQHMRLTFPVLLDAGESAAFAVTEYPAVVALTAEGQALRLNGLSSREALQALLKGL